jgi:drug/metabolite transporter (DMT)-like permease
VAAVFTILALLAFASNSLLTRFALGAHAIDAATFTAIRIGSGALVLALLVLRGQRRGEAPVPTQDRRLVRPLALFAYAAPFSFAYLRIGAAVGALVLFGVVQLSMIGWAVARGDRPPLVAWIGTAIATAGFLLLTLPSVSRPDPIGLALMAVAGVAWAAYTLAGRSARAPLLETARSFLWSSPLALLLLAASYASVRATWRGALLAVISGAVTSGLGYAIWYRALPHLTVTQAAVAQLTVPVIAAAAAVALLHERTTPRLLTSGVTILLGVGLVTLARARRPSPHRVIAR